MYTPVIVGNLCNSESEPEVDARLKIPKQICFVVE